jgi:rod shape-determining protein MreC
MRNIYLFLLRNSVLILFLVLQAIALLALFNFNRFHESVLNMFANEFAGSVYRQIDRAEAYFNLQKENDKLRDQNARLLSMLPSGQLLPDTTLLDGIDSTAFMSVDKLRQYQFLSARVISNSVFLQQNYLMLHRGSSQGVEPNLAVVGAEGIIGTVVNVSPNMATVMSMLHRQSKVIAVLKKGSGLGEVSWDGKDPSLLNLKKIPTTVEVNKGDTVITSPYSDKFPPGYPIGVVVRVEKDQETNTYLLWVKPAVDFNTVQHAYVVQNKLKQEMDQMGKTIIKE